VTKAQNKMDQDIAEAKAKLEHAKQTLNQKFGKAEGNLQNAKNHVDDLQRQINDVKNTINDYEHAHWYEFWKKAAIVGLGIKLAGLEIGKGVGDGILDVCMAVLKGTDYALANAAIPAAEGALTAAQAVGDKAIHAAEGVLQEVDKESAAILSVAQTVLKGVEDGGDKVLKVAETALADFIEAGKAVIQGAQTAIDDLVKSSEWIVYQAATASLALAVDATQVLNVAVLGLQAVKAADNLIIDIAEDVVEGLTRTLNVKEVKLSGSLRGIIGKGGEPFSAAAVVEVLGKTYSLALTLRFGSVEQFIHDLLMSILKEL